MARIYMSFLGLGAFNKETRTYAYDPACYRFGQPTTAADAPAVIRPVSRKTRFVQAAELELLGTEAFDSILILCTDTSHATHFAALHDELVALGVEPDRIHHLTLSEQMDAQGQWAWFEWIVTAIQQGDELTVDVTHGYRIFAVAMSAAIAFIQRARQVRLQGVLYGAYEPQVHRDGQTPVPIADLRHFYVINDWADAVSRLVDDADAGRLAALAGESGGQAFHDLADPELVAALDALTSTIKDVDVHAIAGEAERAIALLSARRQQVGPTGRILIDLALEKYALLGSATPPSGIYDARYFEVQQQFVELLLGHGLYMQGFTALRECLGSLGMLGLPAETHKRMEGSKGFRQRRHADKFAAMIEHAREEWKFGEDDQPLVDRLTPFYERLAERGLIDRLRSFVKEMNRIRNGFDHAWTGQRRDHDALTQAARQHASALFEVVREVLALG